MDKREVFATMLTPYNNEGAVDIPTMRNLVDRCVQKGCSGIYSLSQDAEIFNLSLEERVELNGTVFGRAKAIESILKSNAPSSPRDTRRLPSKSRLRSSAPLPKAAPMHSFCLPTVLTPRTRATRFG